jgi:predicted secreted protein
MAAASGKIVRLYVGAVAIGYATSCKITYAQEVVRISHKDIDPGIDSPGFEQGSAGKKSVKASNQSFFAEDSNSYETLLTALIEGETVVVKMTSNVSGDMVETFTALITQLEKDAPVDGKVTFSVSFDGVNTPTVGTVA